MGQTVPLQVTVNGEAHESEVEARLLLDVVEKCRQVVPAQVGDRAPEAVHLLIHVGRVLVTRGERDVVQNR